MRGKNERNQFLSTIFIVNCVFFPSLLACDAIICVDGNAINILSGEKHNFRHQVSMSNMSMRMHNHWKYRNQIKALRICSRTLCTSFAFQCYLVSLLFINTLDLRCLRCVCCEQKTLCEHVCGSFQGIIVETKHGGKKGEKFRFIPIPMIHYRCNATSEQVIA